MSNGNDTNTTISTQLITASLTMITVIGAFAVFIIEKREINFWYYIVVGTAFLCFVASIVLGALGISGKGKNRSPNPYYNFQAITAFMGILLFGVSIFLGKVKSDDLKQQVDKHEKLIYQLQVSDSINKLRLQELNTIVDSLLKVVPPKPKIIRYKDRSSGNKTIIQYFDSTKTIYNHINQ